MTPTAQIRVLFFGRLAELVNNAEQSISIEIGISAKELYRQLAEQEPRLPALEQDASIKISVNQCLVDWGRAIAAGDEVAFLPPVTGG